jgi:hypothetical protein
MFLIRALMVWLVMMGAEFTHGALRTVLLVPILGDFRARQVSVFTGSLLIVFIAWVFIRWIRAETTAALLLVGFIWLALTLAFDLSLARYVFDRSWESLAAEFNILEGGLFPIGLAILTLSPLIASRLRKPRGNAAHRDSL